jgi:hypothetical protein
MAIGTAPISTGTVLGYARVSTGHQSLDQQVDALTAPRGGQYVVGDAVELRVMATVGDLLGRLDH